MQTFAQRLTRTLIKNSLRAFISQHHHRVYDLSPDPILLTERLVSLSAHQLHTSRELRHHLSAQELSSGIHFDFLTATTTDEEDDPENIYDLPTIDAELEPQTHPVPTPFNTLPAASAQPVQPTCEIYDYDIYYNNNNSSQTPGSTLNTTTTNSSSHNTNSTSSGSKKHYLDTIQRKKPTLYSPRHYHPGGSNLSTANRPNSRNSLNSRLSSSHNSLSVPTTNKADDSIFITQAMSHDTLTGREISDFYNVPIDSDMYSLPVDMVVGVPVAPRSPRPTQPAGGAYKNLRSKLKSQRQQKKRRKHGNIGAMDESVPAVDFKYSTPSGPKVKTTMRSMAEAKRYSVPENSIEPMHMSLEEVKRFYHSLYSSSSEGSASDVAVCVTTAKPVAIKKAPAPSAVSTPSSGANNNNHIVLITPPGPESAKSGCATKTIAQSPAKKKASKCGSNLKSTTVNLKNRKASIKDNDFASSANNNNNTSNSNDKYGCGGKKSQFSMNLNLKQKFCSIFRFRRSGTAHISGGAGGSSHGASGTSAGRFSDENEHTNRLNGGADGASEGRPPLRGSKQNKNPKFMTRALPPLPNKGELWQHDTRLHNFYCFKFDSLNQITKTRNCRRLLRQTTQEL